METNSNDWGQPMNNKLGRGMQGACKVSNKETHTYLGTLLDKTVINGGKRCGLEGPIRVKISVKSWLLQSEECFNQDALESKE